MERDSLIGQIWRSSELIEDLDAICGFGGRFAGTPGEEAARDYLAHRLEEATGSAPNRLRFEFPGWRRGAVNLVAVGGGDPRLDATSLVFSPPTAASELEVIDLGRGTREDFDAAWGEIEGRAVLVRHEFPFSVSHVHRRLKYGWAVEAGARAFLIGNFIAGIGPVTGSSGSGREADIPALGISYEAAALLERRCRSGVTRIRVDLESWTGPAEGEHLISEVPGSGDEVIVLCAHVDGHHLAESALDNGSGLATVLEVTRRLAPVVPNLKRGLRTMFFTAEEWALTGSKLYVESLPEEERRKIALVVNLDTVVGSARLNALVSGRKDVARFVTEATNDVGLPVAPVHPVQANSDHYNFHLAGIPALRLIAGYEDPAAVTRFLLTPADTRDKVDVGQLRLAAMTTLTLVHAACARHERIGPLLTAEEARSPLDRTDPWVADRA